jgi:hypothetical protein
VWQAVVDSVVIYFLVFGVFQTPLSVVSLRGYSDDMFLFGTTTFSAMLMAMMYKAATHTYTWTWVNGFFYIGRSGTSTGLSEEAHARDAEKARACAATWWSPCVVC